MKTQTARPLKTLSVAVLLLTLFFWAFFDISKKSPLLAIVNPFAEDPYDAVGSFGIQLSFFAALLSLLRAFRPYRATQLPSPQRLLILRGETVALLSIVVTLAADLVAMLRYPFMWRASLGGWILLGAVAAVLFLTTLTGLWLYSLGAQSPVSRANRPWMRLIIFPLGLLMLAIYPADLQESIPGGIFSALLGMAILFLCTWVLATVIFPQTEMKFEDVLDDFASIYQAAKYRVRVHSQLGNVVRLRWLHRLFDELNPRRALVRLTCPGGWCQGKPHGARRHNWKFILVVALGMGVSLLLGEALGEGISPDRDVVLLVTTVFLGIEGLGVILGYFLFAEFLGIFRKE